MIRTPDMKAHRGFYKKPGFHLEYHRHGASPNHYFANMGDNVIELYPLAKGQAEADPTRAWGSSWNTLMTDRAIKPGGDPICH